MESQARSGRSGKKERNSQKIRLMREMRYTLLIDSCFTFYLVFGCLIGLGGGSYVVYGLVAGWWLVCLLY